MNRLAAVAAALLVTGPVAADEIWTTSTGEVVYDADIGDTAVLSYPIAVGSEIRGYLYFPGLGGNFENRGAHTGYWVAPGELCPSEMTGANGFKSKAWGQLLIVFDASAFPSGWKLFSGTCFGALTAAPLVGVPKLGIPVEPTPIPAPAPDATQPPAAMPSPAVMPTPAPG